MPSNAKGAEATLPNLLNPLLAYESYRWASGPNAQRFPLTTPQPLSRLDIAFAQQARERDSVPSLSHTLAD